VTVLVSTSLNVRFCSTWENPKRRNRTKCNISLILFPQIVQKQTLGEVENCTVVWSPVTSEILASKLLKSDDPSLSYNRRCPGCSFRTRCIWKQNLAHVVSAVVAKTGKGKEKQLPFYIWPMKKSKIWSSESPVLIMSKLKFWATIYPFVGNLQLFVEKCIFLGICPLSLRHPKRHRTLSCYESVCERSEHWRRLWNWSICPSFRVSVSVFVCLCTCTLRCHKFISITVPDRRMVTMYRVVQKTAQSFWHHKFAIVRRRVIWFSAKCSKSNSLRD